MTQGWYCKEKLQVKGSNFSMFIWERCACLSPKFNKLWQLSTISITRPAECKSGENFATIIAQFVCYVLQDQLSKLLSTLSQTCIKRGGGGKEFIWAHSMGSNRGCPLCSAFQKSNSSSCLSCLVARALFKQFKIKRCLPLLVQICMIAHEAHICTAGIAHRRSGTKDLNDLTENRKRVIIVIFTVQKHQQCLN